MGDELLGRGGRARAQHDERVRYLALERMRLPDDGRLHHRRVLVEHILDLARVSKSSDFVT